jgi:CBS-domain-containing membrane protein
LFAKVLAEVATKVPLVMVTPDSVASTHPPSLALTFTVAETAPPLTSLGVNAAEPVTAQVIDPEY